MSSISVYIDCLILSAGFAVENSIYQGQTSNTLDRMQHCVGTSKHSSHKTILSNRIPNINGNKKFLYMYFFI